ncbi:MAG: hypothetical protein GOVbin3762_2 [Prokaryotic dsDNA virus sp.]|nr:MAG: hypothetical protein GOVbin3762_2 [Prokaryotic dsDNA virus sp.]|tara:strand:- start:4275 stop:4646 length:372 start_codon:yes stop_codon:yes gene_type:complete
MARKFKIVVPKPASCNEHGTEVKLYTADEIVESEGTWQDELMDSFIENGWAMEVKVDSVDETVQVEADVKEVKRARNDKGQLIGDDPDTPDVNEAWEGGEAPKKKTTAKKKTTKKKTTKKASS